MPEHAFKNAPKHDVTDSSRLDDTWYGAFATTNGEVEAQPDTLPATSSSNSSFPDPLDTLTPSDIPGPHMRRDRDDAPLPAHPSQQHAELDRLIRGNGQLLDRIEMLLQMQSRELSLRQQLQNQVDRIAEQLERPVPAATLEAVRRETRAGITEDIKPVLMAILDALERFASKTDAESPAPQNGGPADLFLGEEYGKLPAILTRPLDELMNDGSLPGHLDRETANRRPRSPFSKRTRKRKPLHPAPVSARENSDEAVPVTWSTVFTS